MTGVIINPGTGPVANATSEQAAWNMGTLCRDIRTIVGAKLLLVVTPLPKDDYGNGRFAFRITLDKKHVDVQMPGRPIEKVRYAENLGHDAWEFPRLYVDGDSWLWQIAVGCCAGRLGFEDAHQKHQANDYVLEPL